MIMKKVTHVHFNHLIWALLAFKFSKPFKPIKMNWTINMDYMKIHEHGTEQN